MRVLIVDDDTGACAATVKYLELTGHQPTGAGDGAQALRECRVSEPEVVILDLGLPDMDGFAVIERMKATLERQTTRFIAVSGRSDDATRAKALHAGFDDYLVKPIALDLLLEKITAARGN